MYDVALTLQSETIQRFQSLARQLGMCLVFGFAERDGADVYNCAIFIDDHGRICGKYHKMLLAEGYDPTRWFDRLGSHARAFDTPIGRCGIMICYDRGSPELARVLALDGAELIVIPTYGDSSERGNDA